MKRKILSLILLFAVSFEISSSAATMIFPENRRAKILESLESIIAYTPPSSDELRLIPDPFVFGREIEEEGPEPVIQGLSNEEVLEILASTLQGSIIGYQEFDGRSFLATEDFGLLRDGDTVVMPLPESQDETVSVQVITPTRQGFTIQMEDLETYVPMRSSPSGIKSSRP